VLCDAEKKNDDDNDDDDNKEKPMKAIAMRDVMR